MQDYDLGRVFARMFEMVRANFMPVAGFVLLTVLVSFVISLASSASMFASIGQAMQSGSLDASSMAEIAAASQASQASPLYWIAQAIGLLITSAVLAGCTDACLRSARGENANFSTTLAAALKYCLPVLGFLLLYILAIVVVVVIAALIGGFVAGWLGGLLGLAAFLFLGALWMVALPALVNEDTGVFGAFGRSAALTSGHRGMIILTMILWFLMLFVLALLIVALLGGFGFVLAKISPFLLVILLVPYLAIIIAYQLFSASSMASVYAELRHVKDGGDSVLTDVFS
jgi:hypothetical protein